MNLFDSPGADRASKAEGQQFEIGTDFNRVDFPLISEVTERTDEKVDISVPQIESAEFVSHQVEFLAGRHAQALDGPYRITERVLQLPIRGGMNAEAAITMSADEYLTAGVVKQRFCPTGTAQAIGDATGAAVEYDDFFEHASAGYSLGTNEADAVGM